MNVMLFLICKHCLYFYQSMISLRIASTHSEIMYLSVCVCISGSLSNVSSDANFSCDSGSTNGSCAAVEADGNSPYKTVEMVFIALVTGSLSFVTVVGNISSCSQSRSIDISRPVNNYFLFSLACADLIIGAFSMNLYTVYIIPG